MRAIIVMCVCAFFSGCIEADGNVPLGADLVQLGMVGTYEVGSTLIIDANCQGTAPFISSMKLGTDGIAELESDGVHLARWSRVQDGIRLAPVHAYGWRADEVFFFPAKGGGYEASIEWWNATTARQCTIATTVRRLEVP